VIPGGWFSQVEGVACQRARRRPTWRGSGARASGCCPDLRRMSC